MIDIKCLLTTFSPEINCTYKTKLVYIQNE